MHNKNIYPKDWVTCHPYRIADEIDLYYANLSDKVYKVLSQPDVFDMFGYEKDALMFVAIRLTMWFEDIVSNNGIWKAVTTEFKKRYNTTLPFYETGDDYEEGFVNYEDIRFLLWNEAQSYQYGNCFINPENPVIEKTAFELYVLFDENWETAPENERLHLFIHNDNVLDSYWSARKLLEWFHQFAFVNTNAEYDLNEALASQSEDHFSFDGINSDIYLINIQDTFCHKRNILSITSQQWMARIRDKREYDIWENIKWKNISAFICESEDDTRVVFKDLIFEEKYAVEKESFDNSIIKHGFNNKNDVFLCSLVSFKEHWYQCGPMTLSKMNPKLQNWIDERTIALRNIKYQPTLYPKFLDISNGKELLFVGSVDEIKNIYKHLGFKEVDQHSFPDFDNCIVLCSPFNGISIIPNMCECIFADNNPYYDKEKAMEYAHTFYFDPEQIEYRHSCNLHENNMLPDAKINSLKGDDYGNLFLHKNGSFIIDYCFSCTKQYDYDAQFTIYQMQAI